MELYLVVGGPLAGERPHELAPEAVEIAGVFGDYDEAVEAWRSASQRTVDDAETRYLILPLHRLIAPMIGLDPREDLAA